MRPGMNMFSYNSRGVAEYRAMTLQEPPIIGKLVKHEGDQLTVRRLLTKKAASAGIVFHDQLVSLVEDALFRHQGAACEPEVALANQGLFRVLPAQKLRLSAFASEALMTPDQLDDENKGTRLGYMVEDGDTLRLQITGEDTPYPAVAVSGKVYQLLDNQYMLRTNSGLQPGMQAIGFTYRGFKKPKFKYLLARSEAAGIVDGTITAIKGDELTVKTERDGAELTFRYSEANEFYLNGQKTSDATEYKVGMAITVYQERPQVIDTWTVAP